MPRTEAELQAIERDGQHEKCLRCGRPLGGQSASLHHRKRRREHGARDDVTNVLVLCGSGTTGCHGWCHANPAAAREQGFIVATHDTPALVPIEARGGPMYLTPEGGYSRTPPPQQEDPPHGE